MRAPGRGWRSPLDRTPSTAGPWSASGCPIHRPCGCRTRACPWAPQDQIAVRDLHGQRSRAGVHDPGDHSVVELEDPQGKGVVRRRLDADDQFGLPVAREVAVLGFPYRTVRRLSGAGVDPPPRAGVELRPAAQGGTSGYLRLDDGEQIGLANVPGRHTGHPGNGRRKVLPVPVSGCGAGFRSGHSRTGAEAAGVWPAPCGSPLPAQLLNSTTMPVAARANDVTRTNPGGDTEQWRGTSFPVVVRAEPLRIIMRPAPGAAPCVGDRRPDEQSQRRALRPGRGTAPPRQPAVPTRELSRPAPRWPSAPWVPTRCGAEGGRRTSRRPAPPRWRRARPAPSRRCPTGAARGADRSAST